MRSESYKYVEKCLYEYQKNLSRLNTLELDLNVLRSNGDVHAQNYDAVQGQGISNPVLQYMMKIDRLEHQIKILKRITTPITKLVKDLEKLDTTNNKEFLIILTLYYFGDASVFEVTEKLHVCRRAFFNKKDALIYRAMKYLGY